VPLLIERMSFFVVIVNPSLVPNSDFTVGSRGRGELICTAPYAISPTGRRGLGRQWVADCRDFSGIIFQRRMHPPKFCESASVLVLVLLCDIDEKKLFGGSTGIALVLL